MPNRTNYIQNKRLNRIERKIDRMEDEIEYKYIDTYAAGAAVPTAGTSNELNLVAQGTTQITRIGAQIKMTSIQLRMSITALTSQTQSRCRVMLVIDKEPAGGSLTVSGSAIGGTQAVLDTAVITDLMMAPYQHEARDRFKVVYDKIVYIKPTTAEAAASVTTGDIAVSSQHVINKYIKLNRRVQYSLTTATPSAVDRNMVTLVVIAETANSLTYTYGTRIYFSDM